jgi:hypothetical protein
MVKQNRYNRQRQRIATTVVGERGRVVTLSAAKSLCRPEGEILQSLRLPQDDSGSHLLAFGTRSVSAVYTRLVTTVGGQLFAQ